MEVVSPMIWLTTSWIRRRRSRRFCCVTSLKMQRTETGSDSSLRQLRLASTSTFSPLEFCRRRE